MKNKVTILILSLFFSVGAMAKSKVKALNYEPSNSERGQLTIDLKGPLGETPELMVKDNIIQLSVPDSFVWPKIEKKVSVKNNFDTTLLAYQFNKEIVRVRAMLPYSLAGNEGAVNVILKDNQVILDFPKLGNKNVTKTKKREISNNRNASTYDESYLEKLLKDKATMQKEYGSELAPEANSAAAVNTSKKARGEDEVKMALSANDKKIAGTGPANANSSFSVMSYIGKFVAFLGVVLLLFYGVVALMRKGVMKKGKLGFLNNTKMVEVLSTTYVAPKKSVLMIRAHNQVFLVGSSEAGLQPLGELSDINGLLKEGEVQVTGNNFDTNLFEAGSGNKEFRLKEMTTSTDEKDSQNGGLAALLAENTVEEKVKLSDQIKNKVKNLKSFQQ